MGVQSMKRSTPRTTNLFRETRTRIFLIYVALMLAAVGLAIPVFRSLLFSSVKERVNADLLEEVESFEAAYDRWQSSGEVTVDSLSVMLDRFIGGSLPEDDNFFIALIDGEVYRTNPIFLPDYINSESALMEQWSQMEGYIEGQEMASDPTVGHVLYVVEPLVVDGVTRGQFVLTHLSAGEKREALSGFYIFAQVVGGLLVLALLLAWFLTGRLLRPVKDFADTARAINETDLSGRIEVVGTGELAELATTFNAMMNRLQRSFDSQRNFINDAGHELRTPITIIRGHLELMGDDPDEQAETIDIVIDELDRMGRLVNDLILLVKSEHPNFLRLETVTVEELVTHVFTKAQTLAERDWHLSVETTVRIVADPQRLTGALLNLLNNAAQHTQLGDRIELGCRRRDAQVEFWVKDTGVGIPLSEQVRVFDRFARVQYTQRRSDGSGLGLAIVRAIAEAHDGQVGLSSQPGVGSIFTLTLPIEHVVALPTYQESL
ncbi:MAG: HAMP domain-containing sensor histidine kinase [Cyanobacteria bacterium P01_A01_bin.15]